MESPIRSLQKEVIGRALKNVSTVRNIKIASGGQTGVDRAALDVALELGMECGGWCPKGRRAEDGTISLRYPLKETSSTEYAERTECNVRDSDATLILAIGDLHGGTLLTAEFARRLQKSLLVVDLKSEDTLNARLVDDWLNKTEIKVLNVAGPREESNQPIYQKAASFLRRVFAIGNLMP